MDREFQIVPRGMYGPANYTPIEPALSQRGAQLMESLLVRTQPQGRLPNVALGSLYLLPIGGGSCDLSGYQLRGNSRAWGDAPLNVQRQVVTDLIDATADLPLIDRAIILAMVRVESGFNPDAANPASSAIGLFQMIRRTAQGLGYNHLDLFNVESSISAGIKLFTEEYVKRGRQLLVGLSDQERAIKIYNLHHDGLPMVKSGVELESTQIAKEQILPFLDSFKELILERDAARLG